MPLPASLTYPVAPGSAHWPGRDHDRSYASEHGQGPGWGSEQHLPPKRKLSARQLVLGLGSPGQDGALLLEGRAVQKVVWESPGPAEGAGAGGGGGE